MKGTVKLVLTGIAVLLEKKLRLMWKQPIMTLRLQRQYLGIGKIRIDYRMLLQSLQKICRLLQNAENRQLEPGSYVTILPVFASIQ